MFCIRPTKSLWLLAAVLLILVFSAVPGSADPPPPDDGFAPGEGVRLDDKVAYNACLLSCSVLDVPFEHVIPHGIKAVVWEDAELGCPVERRVQPSAENADALTFSPQPPPADDDDPPSFSDVISPPEMPIPGYLVMVSVGDESYSVHFREDFKGYLCRPPEHR